MIPHVRDWAGVPLLAATMLAGGVCAFPALSQPEPSLRATCGALRQGLAALPPLGREIVTIQVTGAIAAVTQTDAVAFMVVCLPPDPQVVCVAYTSEGRPPGAVITVVGAVNPGTPDRILLDPCIHFAAGNPS